MKSSSSMAFFLLVLLVGHHNYQVNCDSSTEVDEDDSSKENDADNPETYISEQANQISIQKRRSSQPEKPSLTSSRTSNDPLVELTQLIYRGSTIRIYTESAKRNPPRFFYDVMAQVDPKSISVVLNNVVTFTIAMWNRELHSKVLAHVRSLPNLSKVTEQNINVMPFENVILAQKPDSSSSTSMTPLDARKSYAHREDNLQFYLLCNTSETANRFLEDFRQNPAVTLNSLLLVLEGHGLDLGNQLGKNSKYQYIIGNHPEKTTDCKNCLTQLAELIEIIGKMEAADLEQTNKYHELEGEIRSMKTADEEKTRIYQELVGKMRTLETLVKEKTSNYQEVIDQKIIKIENNVQEKTAAIYKELDEKIDKIEDDVQDKTAGIHQKLDEKIIIVENNVHEKAAKIYQELYEKINKLHKDVQETATSYQTELNKKIFKIETAVGEERKSYAFIAQRSSDFTSPNSIVTYTDVHFSEIGTFDRHSGFFTAPVNGVYFFSFNGLKMCKDRSNSYKLLVQLIKIPNGQPNQKLLAGAIVNEIWDSDVYNTVSMQATVLLERGDRVAVKLMQGWLHEPSAPHGSHMTTFTGFLVKTQI